MIKKIFIGIGVVSFIAVISVGGIIIHDAAVLVEECIDEKTEYLRNKCIEDGFDTIDADRLILK